MKSTKVITAALVFIGTFAFSTGLIWLFYGLPQTPNVSFFSSAFSSESVYANDIETFLYKDISNGHQRSRQTYSLNFDGDSVSPAGAEFSSYADFVEDYVDSSSSLDAGELPLDFQKAWHKHMNAWREYSDFLNKLKNTSARKNVSVKDFTKMEESFNHEINRTGYEVLRVGAKYGAEVHGF